MRQLKLVAASATVLLSITVMTGCTGTPPKVARLSMPSSQPVAALPAAVDPMLTQQACAAAAFSAADSTKVFHDQMDVIEKAAAKDDTGTLITAADTIQRAFVQLAKGLGSLAKKPLTPAVRAALSAASDTVTEISSTTYVGSTADINQRLTDLSTSLAQVCP